MEAWRSSWAHFLRRLARYTHTVHVLASWLSATGTKACVLVTGRQCAEHGGSVTRHALAACVATCLLGLPVLALVLRH